jgi:hypothetical protein
MVVLDEQTLWFLLLSRMSKLAGFSFFHKIKVEIKDQIYTGTINLYDSISILPSLVFSCLDPLGVIRARVEYENCFEKLVFFIEFNRELIFDSRNQEKKTAGKILDIKKCNVSCKENGDSDKKNVWNRYGLVNYFYVGEFKGYTINNT